MLDSLRREGIYLWYYFSVQLEQVFRYWVLGMVIGSAISVFAKDRLHGLFRAMAGRRLGVFGVVPASLLGIASPLCMYGTIPIAASFARQGMRHDWLAAPADPVQRGAGDNRPVDPDHFLLYLRYGGRMAGRRFLLKTSFF